MTPFRLAACLDTLGWTARELGRRCDRNGTTVGRWLSGATPVPQPVAAWLERLAAAHEAHPGPVWRVAAE